MAKLINAKCPNCGAILELPENLDRAFCIHCGGKVIIAKDVHYHGGKTAIACPECGGTGYHNCIEDSIIFKKISGTKFKKRGIIVSGCKGTGKCKAGVLKTPTGPTQCLDGKCMVCKGEGRGLLSVCKLCNGTGKCPICKGTGRCTSCNGKGKFKCKACNGTGFKVYEGGVSR